jgi:hypothetical protein
MVFALQLTTFANVEMGCERLIGPVHACLSCHGLLAFSMFSDRACPFVIILLSGPNFKHNNLRGIRPVNTNSANFYWAWMNFPHPSSKESKQMK